VRLNDITAAQWTINMLDPDQVVADAAVINQRIEVLFATPEGSIPGAPEKGHRLEGIIDRPLFEAVPDLIKEVYRAIPLWIPEIKLVSVKVKTFAETASAQIKIVWKYKEKTGKTEVKYVK